MTARSLDVLSLGEALVDLLPDRRGRLRDCDSFTPHSGGAPSNVAVGCARLGLRTGFAGVLGDDEFGRLLERKLLGEGIRTHLRFTKDAPTGCWFIALDENGNRSFFSPSGPGSADKLVSVDDVRQAPIADANFLHCGSSSHVRPEAREALHVALSLAREAGTQTSFDPNVRPHLWKDPRELRAMCLRAFPLCDVVKLSDEESEAALGEADPHRALSALADLGVGLACVTLGPKGAIAQRGADRFEIAAPKVEVVDTTGAGDGFVAGLLSLIAGQGAPRVRDLPRETLEDALHRACAVGSRVCTHLGAVGGLPFAQDL